MADRGMTRLELLVVVVILIVLASLVTLLPMHGRRDPVKSTCRNNLIQIGSLLAIRNTANRLRDWSGAAFVLQVVDDVEDEDLAVFLCPGEGDVEGRPEEGTPAFIEMYRRLELPGGVERRHCSYAGPNWRRFPRKSPGGPLLWACDRCRDGYPHHDGLTVLWATGKVEFLELTDLEGYDPESGWITVGPDSPDPRLSRMCYLPPR